jgi:hypothetical protein
MSTANPTRAALAAVQHYLDRKHMNNRFDGMALTRLRDENRRLREACPDLLDSDDEQLVADMIEGSTSINEILEPLAQKLLRTELDIDAIEHEIQRLQEYAERRKGRFERRRDMLRRFAQQVLEEIGQKSWTTALASFSLRPGPRKVLVDEPSLPDAYWRTTTTRTPNKIEIGKRLKDGEHIPGATLSNAETVINIKFS